jgi:hypothetical protein
VLDRVVPEPQHAAPRPVLVMRQSA